MREQSFFGPAITARRFSALVLSVFILVSAGASVQAQSGRRPPKQPSTADPKPPPQPEPLVQPSRTEKTPRLPILAVKDMHNVGISSIYSSIALDGCLEELKLSPAVEVSSGKDKTRKEASDYAKASNIYVVLIQLEQEISGRSDATGGDPRTLFVSYLLFTPGTGKLKTSGRIYQGAGRVSIGAPVPNTRAIVDYELKRCGRDAADRVLSALDLARPQRR